MTFPLMTVLTAAPSVISAAADIIRALRDRKNADGKSPAEKMAELESLIEKQAVLIEELAVSNRNLALAVRNNRIVTVLALAAAVAAGLAVFLR